MPHSAAITKKLETFLHRVVDMDLQALAQQHMICGEELLEIESESAARATRALIAAVDSIGKVKFPREWEDARDSIGHDQDAA